MNKYFSRMIYPNPKDPLRFPSYKSWLHLCIKISGVLFFSIFFGCSRQPSVVASTEIQQQILQINDSAKGLAQGGDSQSTQVLHQQALQMERVMERTGLERIIAILLISMLAMFVILVFLFLRKTNRLNTKLNDALQVRDKLFSIIAHDLRGPASGLVQSLHVVGAGLFTDEEERKMISSLRVQSVYLMETLDNLLRWSRSQLYGVKVTRDAVAVYDSVGHAINLLKGQLEQKKLDVQCLVDESLSVFADTDQFDFIIRNILSNAIKYSNAGSSIQVKGRTVSNDMIIEVIDHGVGMTEKQQEQFKYGTLEPTPGTYREKGTGLGLLLVRDFVLANNGQIQLMNTPGGGLTIYISLDAQERQGAKGEAQIA